MPITQLLFFFSLSQEIAFSFKLAFCHFQPTSADYYSECFSSFTHADSLHCSSSPTPDSSLNPRFTSMNSTLEFWLWLEDFGGWTYHVQSQTVGFPQSYSRLLLLPSCLSVCYHHFSVAQVRNETYLNYLIPPLPPTANPSARPAILTP